MALTTEQNHLPSTGGIGSSIPTSLCFSARKYSIVLDIRKGKEEETSAFCHWYHKNKIKAKEKKAASIDMEEWENGLKTCSSLTQTQFKFVNNFWDSNSSFAVGRTLKICLESISELHSDYIQSFWCLRNRPESLPFYNMHFNRECNIL